MNLNTHCVWMTSHWPSRLLHSRRQTRQSYVWWYHDKWLDADQATSHYLNQWWLTYALLGLNELTSHYLKQRRLRLTTPSGINKPQWWWHRLAPMTVTGIYFKKSVYLLPVQLMHRHEIAITFVIRFGSEYSHCGWYTTGWQNTFINELIFTQCA